MKELVFLLPQIDLLVAALVVIFSEITHQKDQHRISYLTTLVGFLGALFQVGFNYVFLPELYWGGVLVHDGTVLFFQICLLFAGLITTYFLIFSKEIRSDFKTEYYTILLVVTALLMVAVSSAHLLLLWVTLQGALILSSLLIAQKRLSQEALRAAVQSMGLATFFFVFFGLGVLLFFSVAQTLFVFEAHRLLVQQEFSVTPFVVSFFLLFFGLGSVVCIFPQQLWGFDAYREAPAPTALFLSISLRIAGLAVLLRLLVVLFSKKAEFPGSWVPIAPFDWRMVVALVAVTTLCFGAILSYTQTEVKKLFSSLIVAQSGFYTLGLLTLDEIGFASLLYNLMAEVFSVAGAYAALSFFLDRLQGEKRQIAHLRGALSAAFPEGLLLVFFVLSWVGVPPFPGFIGKITLISSAVRQGWGGVALISTLATSLCVISALRFIFQLISGVREDLGRIEAESPRRTVLFLLLLPLFFMGIFSEWFLRFSGESAQLIFW